VQHVEARRCERIFVCANTNQSVDGVKIAFVAREVQRCELIFGSSRVRPFFDLLVRNLEHFLRCFNQKANFSMLAFQNCVMQQVEIFIVLDRFNRYTSEV